MSADWLLLDRGSLSPRWPAVIAWTDEELVIWGGTVFRGARDLSDGAAYNPATDSWRQLDSSPLGTVRQAQWLWTGSELVVRSTDGVTTEDVAAAWDPARNSWRPLPDWPLRGRSSDTLVWTGSTIIDVAASTAIDLGSGDTRAIARVRHTKRLVRRYGRATRCWCSPVGPTTRWPTHGDRCPAVRWGVAALPLPGSRTAAVVVDSELNSAEYHPATDSWSSLPDLPLTSLGCDPRIHAAWRTVIAEMCGNIALLDADGGTWIPLAPPRSVETNTVVAGGDQLFEWGEGFYLLRHWLLAGAQPTRLMIGSTTLDVPTGWLVRRADLVAPDHIEIALGGPAGETCTAFSSRRGARPASPAGGVSMKWRVSDREVFQLSCEPASAAKSLVAGVVVPNP